MSAMRSPTPVASPTVMYGEQYERGHSSLGHVLRHPRDCETPIDPIFLDDDDDLADSVVLDDHLLDRLDPEEDEGGDVCSGTEDDDKQLITPPSEQGMSSSMSHDSKAVTPVEQ